MIAGRWHTPLKQVLIRSRATQIQFLDEIVNHLTEHGAMGRVQIIRIVKGQKRELKVKETDRVQPEDTIIVPQRFF